MKRRSASHLFVLALVDATMALALAAFLVPAIRHGCARGWAIEEYEVGAGPPGTTRRPGRLVVMTWNLARLRGPDYPDPGLGEVELRGFLDRIVSTVAEAGPDILFLQECDHGAQDSFGIVADREIAERAFGDAAVVYGSNYDARVGPWTWRSGNAIVSRFPVLESDLVEFEGYFALRRRFVGAKKLVSARLALPVPGGELAVHDVHLYAYDREQRDRELRAVALRLEPGIPAIVAGDFNLDPETRERGLARYGPEAFAPFEAAGLVRVPPDSSVRTFHSARPDRTIDYVLAPSAPVEWRVLETGESDHRPLVVAYPWDRMAASWSGPSPAKR